jgi:hypothetical protein
MREATASLTLPLRLVAGLLVLKHMHSPSGETLCARWVEKPYFQYFCGERVFRPLARLRPLINNPLVPRLAE